MVLVSDGIGSDRKRERRHDAAGGMDDECLCPFAKNSAGCMGCV